MPPPRAGRHARRGYRDRKGDQSGHDFFVFSTRLSVGGAGISGRAGSAESNARSNGRDTGFGDRCRVLRILRWVRQRNVKCPDGHGRFRSGPVPSGRRGPPPLLGVLEPTVLAYRQDCSGAMWLRAGRGNRDDRPRTRTAHGVRRRRHRPCDIPCSATTPDGPHSRSTDCSTARRQPCRPRRMADREGHRPAETLALADGEPVATKKLVASLWPGSDQQRGNASLRTAVSQVRRIIGCDQIERSLSGLRLRHSWVDVSNFRHLATEAHRFAGLGRYDSVRRVARQADALYRGDFGAHDDGAEWVQTERRDLCAAHQTLLCDAAEAAILLGSAVRVSISHSERRPSTLTASAQPAC